MPELPALPPNPAVQHADRDREERAALRWASLLAVGVVFWLLLPIGIGILLGTFLAFMVEHSHDRLRVWLGVRWAATATVAAASLGLVATIGGLGWLFVAKGTTLARMLIDAFNPGAAGDRALVAVGRFTARLGISQHALEQRARGLVSEIADRTADIAATIASTTGSALLALFFGMLAMSYVLRNWDAMSRRAQETFPLRPVYTRALFDEFRTVGRTTLLGAIGTGIAQGVFATIAYWLGGVPEPLFFGAATAIASFVPAVGTLLVIVPVTIGLVLVDMPGHAALELALSLVFVVAICDYVIRPRLVQGETKMSALITFASLFGGVEAFGLQGLILGPVLMSLALAVLGLYAAEARGRGRDPVVIEP
ncbi:MAG: AI-2E family transporter [Kofleriaceae bacterium]